MLDEMAAKIKEVDWTEEVDWHWDKTSPTVTATAVTTTSPSRRSVGRFAIGPSRARNELAAQVMRDPFPDGYSPERTISGLGQRQGSNNA